MNLIDKIEKDILDRYKFFDYGFSNMYIDYSAKKILNYSEEEYIEFGIDDRLGNYFYIRHDGDTSIDYGVDVIDINKNIEIQNNYSLVAVVDGADAEKLLYCLINVLGLYNNLKLYKAYITKERVINSEYSFLNSEDRNNILYKTSNKTLIKVLFNTFEYYQPFDKECFCCNPSKTCDECNKEIVDLGCFNSCDPIETGIKVDEEGMWKIELFFLNTSYYIKNNYKVDEEIKITEKLNEDYLYKFNVYSPSNELKGTYKFNTYKTSCL